MSADDLAVVIGFLLAVGIFVFKARGALRRESLPLMKSPSAEDRRKFGVYVWMLVGAVLLVSGAICIWIILNN